MNILGALEIIEIIEDDLEISATLCTFLEHNKGMLVTLGQGFCLVSQRLFFMTCTLYSLLHPIPPH